MSTSDERLAPLRAAKHSVGASRFFEALPIVPEIQHGRVFLASPAYDPAGMDEVRQLIDGGWSAVVSYKTTDATKDSEVETLARFLASLGVGTTGKGRWLILVHYHEPENLNEKLTNPTGAAKWYAMSERHAGIVNRLAPLVVIGSCFTGEPGFEPYESKPWASIVNFLRQDAVWLPDILMIDRYVHNVIRRTPPVAWGTPLGMASGFWQRRLPLFIAEFGVDATAQQRADWVRSHSAYVALQRTLKNNSRILGTTWFHSNEGPQAPLVFNGTHSWKINEATDRADTLTPAAWNAFAREYPMSRRQRIGPA